MGKKNKKLLITSVIILAVIILIAVITVKKIEANLAQLTNLPISDVSLAQVADGTYIGSYKVFPVAAKVEVTVEGHQITKIELLEHNHGQGKEAEIIPGRVVEYQSLQVDAVSGATYSSKVILKAIENAINSFSQ